jgi:hypothetical protein
VLVIFVKAKCFCKSHIVCLIIIVILAVILYGCASLTLREEHRLWVCENKVLGKIHGAKMEQVAVDWRKLHDEELHDLC